MTELPTLLRAASTHAPAGCGIILRRAARSDVRAIVALLADDPLGRDREAGGHRDGHGDLTPYLAAYESIDTDPSQLLVVAAADDEVVATMQLSFIPGLSRGGMLRAQIEAVRVHERLRGSGLGAAIITWAIGESQRRGCGLVQLTTDKQRQDAHRFYAGLGFTASHEGFKLSLDG